MQKFGTLLDRLIVTPGRNDKLRLIVDYCRTTPDPDRGYAIAAITRDLDFASVKPAALRALVSQRIDTELFELSYNYVGDLAETIALVWPAKHGANISPTVSDVVESLRSASRSEGPQTTETYLDALDPSARWAMLKMITGGLRVGVSARLAKVALAQFGDKPIDTIEELWHSIPPPYTELFAWLEGHAKRPEIKLLTPFRPVMLAHPLDQGKNLDEITADSHAAEWKWDGVRVQASARNGERRLYSRTGDDIGAAFPDILDAMNFDATIDGELLIYDPDQEAYSARSFGDLQQRLNRKSAPKKLLGSHPAFIRAYDILTTGGDDLRPLAFRQRRSRLEALFKEASIEKFDISPLVQFENTSALCALRESPPHRSIEGLMLKRWASPYMPGRPKGQWWKWKKDPFLIDAVMMYAQRGHGKRSSFYSDYTFGVWRGNEIVPVGKAYFGFTDEELKELDRFVRNNTTDRFGPVRQVAFGPDIGLVLEIAFDGLNRSTRHKSGVAMRFPRINRIRWDKPAAEADQLETLQAMLSK